MSGSNLLTYHLPLRQEIWLAVYSRSDLIGVTYMHLLLTDSLTDWSIDPSITYSTCRLKGIFLQTNNLKLWLLLKNGFMDLKSFRGFRETGPWLPILYNSEKKAKSVGCKIEEMRSRFFFFLISGHSGVLLKARGNIDRFRAIDRFHCHAIRK